jgi:hypothetical protein
MSTFLSHHRDTENTEKQELGTATGGASNSLGLLPQGPSLVGLAMFYVFGIPIW